MDWTEGPFPPVQIEHAFVAHIRRTIASVTDCTIQRVEVILRSQAGFLLRNEYELPTQKRE